MDDKNKQQWNDDDSALNAYLEQMETVSELGKDEEIALAQHIDMARRAKEYLKANPEDEHARDWQVEIDAGAIAQEHLFKAYSQLVVSIAKLYAGRGIPILDLISAGNLGLLRAIEKYDHRRGHRFGTYASWWIRQSITRTIRDKVDES